MNISTKKEQNNDSTNVAKPFSVSSICYDHLYQDKDYVKESNYIHDLLKMHCPSASNILEMGCGTGIHATYLANMGFDVCGFDINPTMIEKARSRVINQFPEISDMLQFSQGDMTTYRSNKHFDVVISLFSAICYQITNKNLLATFKTASDHLMSGGLFIFDAWYGPAVLTQRPEVRIKKIQADNMVVTRIAEPKLFSNNNQVDIKYTYLMQDLSANRNHEVIETHQVRYLFQPEVASLFSQVNMDIVEVEEWVTKKYPGDDTWDTSFIGRKR